eukprot:scaffold8977_cov128-Isochrysis_galbana.AAC.2
MRDEELGIDEIGHRRIGHAQVGGALNAVALVLAHVCSGNEQGLRVGVVVRIVDGEQLGFDLRRCESGWAGKGGLNNAGGGGGDHAEGAARWTHQRLHRGINVLSLGPRALHWEHA